MSTRHEPPGGPYCDDDGRMWWVAVEDCGYLEARRMVKGVVEMEPDQALAYHGREDGIHLWDEEGCCADDEDDHDAATCDSGRCRHTEAWAFEVVER